MKESEFTSLVLPLRDRMFRYAQSLLLSPAEAEDAVHDLLERLWRERGRLEVRELVRRVLGCLPERQREVLHLKDIEGYSTREIAGMVACDEAQVRVILSRARNGL